MHWGIFFYFIFISLCLEKATHNLGKFLYPPGNSFYFIFYLFGCAKRWEYQITWSASWEICMQVRKQQLELDMEQQTGSK